jgi:hypothetical protein
MTHLHPACSLILINITNTCTRSYTILYLYPKWRVPFFPHSCQYFTFSNLMWKIISFDSLLYISLIMSKFEHLFMFIDNLNLFFSNLSASILNYLTLIFTIKMWQFVTLVLPFFICFFLLPLNYYWPGFFTPKSKKREKKDKKSQEAMVIPWFLSLLRTQNQTREHFGGWRPCSVLPFALSWTENLT